MTRVRWGIISTAKIGVEKVIPAMQRSQLCAITAIASRDVEKAQQVARQLGIAKAYGSYEQLLDDPDIDAVYNPLPNHLHVPVSLKALESGKHVLCEKPLALSSAEAQTLVDTAQGSYPDRKVMEAFMYRHHPQWQQAKRLVQEGQIGALRTVASFFSYFNDDANNIRNIASIGGGGLMDIGCYSISLSRFLFDAEPLRVLAHVDYDPRFQTDRMASAILDFGRGTATFTCSTQLAPYQRVQIFGTSGRVEIEIPFNAPPDRPCRMWHQVEDCVEQIELDVCDQYTIQGDLFARAILDDTPVPTPLTDAVANLRVIEAVMASGKQGGWAEL